MSLMQRISGTPARAEPPKLERKPLVERNYDNDPEVQAMLGGMVSVKRERDNLRHDLDFERTENRIKDERIKMLEAALEDAKVAVAQIKKDRDKVVRHLDRMLAGFHHIKLVINDEEAAARAHAYAPPGSGTDELTPIDHAAELEKTLAQEPLPEVKANGNP